MSVFWIKKDEEQEVDEKALNPFAKKIGHGDMFYPDPDKDKEAKDTKGEYEKYCQQQLDNMLDDMEDRCFGDMAEGQFVRSH